MKVINVAVVGLGYWGPNLVRNFYANTNFNVTWVCDLFPENLHKISLQYPSIQGTKNISDILKDAQTDLVVVATPPETHYALGKMVLNSGKHLWVEKPFTDSHANAKKLALLAKKKKLHIHVDLPFIFYGPVLKIKELLQRHEIGKPFYYTSFRTNLGLIQKETDVVYDLAPHDLSILFYLFPDLKIKKVSIDGSDVLGNNNQKQIANLVLYGENNFVAYIHLSWLSPAKIRLITIGGKNKMILFDDIEPSEKVKIYDKSIKIKRSEISPFKPIYRSGDVAIPSYDQKEALENQIQFLYEQLTSLKQNKLSTADIALKIHAILKAAK